MPTPQRRNQADVVASLLQEPYRFEFFQAVRLLQRWSASEGLGPLGKQVRFRNSIALSFPPSEIEQLRVVARELGPLEPTAPHRSAPAGSSPPTSLALLQHIEITPAFMGLLGVAGALPMHYTESIAQRELYQKDFAARAFLDLFSHRAVSMFHAAWRKHRLPLQYEEDRRRYFLPLVLSLAGFGQVPLRDRLDPAGGGVDDHSLAFFAGAIHQRVTSAVQLERLLAHYLRVPVKLEQFCGRMYALPPAARTMLGVGGGVLGKSALAGERVWQRDLRVKLQIGPLHAESFRRFLPGGAGSKAISKLLMLFTGASLEYEVNLTLAARAIEGSVIRSDRPSHVGLLGWDSYLQTKPPRHDRCDVRYDALALH